VSLRANPAISATGDQRLDGGDQVGEEHRPRGLQVDPEVEPALEPAGLAVGLAHDVLM
jgi:hypothetical protein